MIENILAQAQSAIEQAQDVSTLEAIRVDYLGKKGELTEILKQLGQLPAADRVRVGQQVNGVKRTLVDSIEQKMTALMEEAVAARLASERLDVTLPGRQAQYGTMHPVTQVREKSIAFFESQGFLLADGPEIETEFYNFEALNIPSHHPARAMHDTFYFGDGRLLRTHTSNVQIRALQEMNLPLRLIAPGRVYRCDSDMTHTPMFHQLECLIVDESVNLGHLKGLLQAWISDFFGKEVAVRFRPSYFPFTEPSAEVDIMCTQCDGAGCRSCHFTGWLEFGGCGMVHPRVFEALGIDAQKYQGVAFGMGLDRLAMLYFGIEDLRAFFDNEIAFLSQF
ncbi:MAG: phenylalanine--tRNA ligase subunit alpha [Legionellaceae bacterium]|nr:phenylalanine--tRNA ligase subunit alpha [Legionellaceae bacterium]